LHDVETGNHLLAQSRGVRGRVVQRFHQHVERPAGDPGQATAHNWQAKRGLSQFEDFLDEAGLPRSKATVHHHDRFGVQSEGTQQLSGSLHDRRLSDDFGGGKQKVEVVPSQGGSQQVPRG
jgi:hypothetical protein